MTDISPHENAILRAVLNILIPANKARAIPAAGDLGVADFITNNAAQCPALLAHIHALSGWLIGQSGEVSVQAVRDLEQQLPEAFNALLVETYKGYYSRPDMRALVGVGAHPVHPKGYAVASETKEFMDELTAPVRARGEFYRDTRGA